MWQLFAYLGSCGLDRDETVLTIFSTTILVQNHNYLNYSGLCLNLGVIFSTVNVTTVYPVTSLKKRKKSVTQDKQSCSHSVLKKLLCIGTECHGYLSFFFRVSIAAFSYIRLQNYLSRSKCMF